MKSLDKNKILSKKFPFYIPTIFVCISLISVYSYPREKVISFKNLTIENGLSQSTIMNILQDKKGFLWFGTGNGLNKYDGYSFTVYTNIENDSTSISDNVISAIYEDEDGFIWIGTDKGVLNKFDRTTEKFLYYPLNYNSNKIPDLKDDFYKYPIIYSRNNKKTITSITGDKKGNLWVGTWGCGIIKLNKYTGKISQFVYHTKDTSSISYNRIRQIFIDHSGRIWIATFGKGLNLAYNSNGKLIFKHFLNDTEDNFSINCNVINSMYEDKNNNLWIATYDGLNKLDNNIDYSKENKPRFIRYLHHKLTNSLSSNVVMAVTGDNKGNIWIGTFGGGLDKLEPDKNIFTNYKNDPCNHNSLIDNKIISLYRDRANVIWIGTYLGKGISILRESMVKFNTLKYDPSDPNGLNDNIVWSIYEDNSNVLWIGTNNGGLNKYDRKTGKISFFVNDSGNSKISGNQIRAITEDEWGNLWLGTYNSGLNVFIKDKGIFKSYKYDPTRKNGITSNQIQSLYIDSSSTLWVGTFGGGLCKTKLDKYSWRKELKFIHYKNDISDTNSISDNRVYTIFEDREGTLWVGTFGGLNKFGSQNKKFIRYFYNPINSSSLSDNRVLVINEDKKGFMWIGTYGGGLNKLDKSNGKFTRYLKFNGIRINIVYGIVEDDKGFLWLSADNGVLKLSSENETFEHYNIYDGLQSLEFSGGAYFKNKQGEIFFGGINGINYFHPDSIKINPHVPPIAVTSFKIFNKSIKGEFKEYTLTHDKNFFTLEFAALDYTNPVDNHFAYKLEGFDKEWHYTNGNMHYASFMNLDPGEYVFKVKGSNNDGIWNNRGTLIKLTILPPFWQEWWFILFVILTVSGILFSLIFMKVNKILSLERLKAKLASDLHDNIGAGLTEISILSELVVTEANKISETAVYKLKNISEISRQLIDAMSDIVWVVNPKRDSLHDLIIRLKDSYSDLLSYIGISFKTSNIDILENIKLPMEYRQNLYLIFKEGINNCIKHSRCKRIMLDTNLKGRNLEITLKDDGQGMANSNSSLGNGMHTMETRARAIGGRISVISNPQKGTSIKFVGRIETPKNLKHKIRKIIRHKQIASIK